MTRRLRKILWRISLWRITRQTDARLRELRKKREKAARQHRSCAAIDAEMKQIRTKWFTNG